jgi:hypothetical protein
VSKLLTEMTAEGVIGRDGRRYILLKGQLEKTDAARTWIVRPH